MNKMVNHLCAFTLHYIPDNDILKLERWSHLTLDNSQQDDNDEEEEGDVKDHTIELVLIPGWVLNLVSYTPTSTHTHVHMEQVTLADRKRR